MGTNLNINTNTARKRRDLFPPVLLDGNTVAWYDSNLLNTITKDGSDFVSAWNDKLGSGHDLLQAVGIKQPKWFSVNGILFDGISDFIKTASFTFNQPEFIYIVLKQVTWVINRVLIDGDGAFSTALRQYTSTPSLVVQAGLVSSLNSNLAVDTFGISRILSNGASSKFIVNQTTPVTGDFGASNMSGISMGASGGDNSFGNIQIKEAIYRKVSDNATDEAAIYNYLSKKYGI